MTLVIRRGPEGRVKALFLTPKLYVHSNLLIFDAIFNVIKQTLEMYSPFLLFTKFQKPFSKFVGPLRFEI